MESKFVGAGLVLALVGLLAPACSGEDAPVTSTEPDAGADVAVAIDAGGDDTSATGECVVNDDCTARLPPTTPAGCAVATCDTLQKKCHFKAKDVDGDGHTAKACSAATATIETGDDCDDSDNKSYPGAWDGPSTSPDGGAADPDRCDQKDNDCNGSPDDGKIAVDGGSKTCKCDPTAPLPCYEFPNGAPIDATTLDANNNPKGACKKGTRTCPNGVPGTCVGAVGPSTEMCDDLDRDCNGKSGNAGDTVATAPLWYKDIDNDGYGEMATAAKQQCTLPATGWKQLIPNSDCNDGDSAINPGLAEVCDGKDNNCNGVADEGVKTSYCVDADTDGYCTASCVMACAAPDATYRPQASCTGALGSDCNDGNLNIHPNAPEVCNSIDDNCTAGADEGWSIGSGCTAGNAGVCKRNGTTQCLTTASTYCAPGPGSSSGEHQVASTDSLIYTGSNTTAYTAQWDWNCNGAIDWRPDGFGSGGAVLATGTVATKLCNGDFQGACASNSGTAGGCKALVYPCGTNCGGLFCNANQSCGKGLTVAYCLWQYANTNTCDTYNNGTSAMNCQ